MPPSDPNQAANAAIYVAAGAGLLSANSKLLQDTPVSGVIALVGLALIGRGTTIVALPGRWDLHTVERQILAQLAPLRPVAVAGLVVGVVLVGVQLAWPSLIAGDSAVARASGSPAPTSRPSVAAAAPSGSSDPFLSLGTPPAPSPGPTQPPTLALPRPDCVVLTTASIDLGAGTPAPSETTVVSHGLLLGFPEFRVPSSPDPSLSIKAPAGADGYFEQGPVCIPATGRYELLVRVERDFSPVTAYIDVVDQRGALHDIRFAPCEHGTPECEVGQLQTVDLAAYRGQAVRIRCGASSWWPTAPTAHFTDMRIREAR